MMFIRWLYFVLLVGLLVAGCKPCSTLRDQDEIVRCMAEYPVREIPSPRHKVYISLTTSPKRLSRVHFALESLDLSHVEAIFLALPEKYRNQQSYGSTAELERQFPKLKVIRRADDLGPIMKLLPAAEEVAALGDPNAIVITIDDDIAYPKGMVNELIQASTKRDAVTAGWGTSAHEFGLDADWPEAWAFHPALNIVEGFSAVAYPVKYVDVPKMTAASQMGIGNVCRTSDDVVISWVLAKNRVPRFLVRNRFFPDVAPFPMGPGEDTLTAGVGCESAACDMRSRYGACVKALSRWHY